MLIVAWVHSIGDVKVLKVSVKQGVVHTECSRCYHYTVHPGKPISAAVACVAGGEAEQTVNSTLESNHMCFRRGAHMWLEQYNGILQPKSGKTVKAEAWMTWLGGAWSWAFLPRATNGWSRLKQAATDKERLNLKAHDPCQMAWADWHNWDFLTKWLNNKKMHVDSCQEAQEYSASRLKRPVGARVCSNM